MQCTSFSKNQCPKFLAYYAGSVLCLPIMPQIMDEGHRHATIFLHLKNNMPQHSITVKAKWQLHLFSALFCPLHRIRNDQQCEESKVWWTSVKASWHSHYILLLCSHRIRSQRGKEFMCVLYRHISG